MIGQLGNTFLCERMFYTMAEKDSNVILLKGFLDYNEILMHGTEEEKQGQNFKMMDLENANRISLPTFKKFVVKTLDMFSAALSSRVRAEDNVI